MEIGGTCFITASCFHGGQSHEEDNVDVSKNRQVAAEAPQVFTSTGSANKESC